MRKEEKEKRTSHILDAHLKEKMVRILDLVQQVQYSYQGRYTDFLTPYEQREAAKILEGLDGICYSLDGMIASAERKIISIYPDYEENHSRDFLSCLKIKGNFQFRKVTHRDYLGSILGMGIKRECIGDIFPCEDGAYVVCLSSVTEYLLFHLEKIANVSVKLSEVGEEEIVISKPHLREQNFVVSSLRLDAIVAGMFRLSRSEAQKVISGELVSVDYETITNSSKILSPPTIISARGFGKGRFEEVLYQTKKERWRIKTLLY